MNNELIPTNGLWYKIKKFFKNIFFKEKMHNINEMKIVKKEQKNNNFSFDYNFKEKFENEKKKQNLAEELLYGGVGISELTEKEVDEMTEYFRKDIQNIDNELLRIKKHILDMQQELKQYG